MTSSRETRRTLLPTLSAVLAVALLALVPSGPAGASDRGPGDPSGAQANGGRGDASYTLLQLNLCLSGLAGCFGGTEYPKVVEEAAATIDRTEPDVVTLNESCRGDSARIAEETGYRLTFSTVIYNGAPLECKNPLGRGFFGNAVLTRERVVHVNDRAYQAQSGAEERRYACATTVRGLTACVTHLSTGGTPETNEAQCQELTAVLARHARWLPTIFAGDVNRLPECAPSGFWTVDDSAATQAPGIQHAYGSYRGFARGEATVVPLTYTDHDGLLVETRFRRPW